MEQITKDDLLQLVGGLEFTRSTRNEWPEELRKLYDLTVQDVEAAERFSQELVEQQRADKLIAAAMPDVQIPVDLKQRITSALAESFDSDFVKPRLSEVTPPVTLDPTRRNSVRWILAMTVAIFGLAMWPFLAGDSFKEPDLTQVQQSISLWIAELDQFEAWQQTAELRDTGLHDLVQTLDQHMQLGALSRYARLADGQLVLDYSSPRNGRVVVFVLAQNAPILGPPVYEPIQVSGPFAAAIGKIGSLRVLVVTNESMKRVSEFWQS